MNKKRLGVFCGVIAIAIVLAMIAVPAGAAAGAEVGAEVDWSDPEVIIHTIEELQQKGDSAQAAFAELPREAQAAIEDLVRKTPITYEETTGEGAAGVPVAALRKVSNGNGGASCTWTWRKLTVSQGIFWKYWQKINWCYTVSTVDSGYRTRGGSANWPWNYKGHSSGSTYLASTFYTAFTQGTVQYCLIGCLPIYKYPWIDQKGKKNNGYWDDWGV